MTLEELYRLGVSRLGPGEGAPQAAAREALALLVGAARLGELDYVRDPGREAGRRTKARFMRSVRRRRSGAPLSYLTGSREFWSMPFAVGRGVFIPRPETELLIELVLARAEGAEPSILDLGTGSGCIALALAGELAGARIAAADISRRALRTARRNLRRLTAGKRGEERHPEHEEWSGRGNTCGERRRMLVQERGDGCGGRVSFIRSDFFSAFAGRRGGAPFDIIVSNPPYVSEGEWRALEPGVRDFEPRRALVPGKTGLEALRRIIEESPAYLKPGGWLVMEIGSGQGEAVAALFDGRWRDVECHADLAGLPRAVSGRLTTGG